MAENKQYVTQTRENGTVMISEDVIATIIEHAIKEVEGVAGFSTKPGADIAELFGKKNQGLKIQIAEDNSVTIICNVMVYYGHSVMDVANNLQHSVTSAVESFTGVKVSAVHVNICGIVRK